VITDANSVPSGTVLETEVRIVGAGAAGVTLAREFINSPFRVMLLESGGMEYEQETQDLYDSENVGRALDSLTTGRFRLFGGTTNFWGGWCLPYDAIDFEARDGQPYSGWPFPKSHLDPWYQRAQEVCQLGPYDYRLSSWGITPDKVPAPFAGPDFECKVVQMSGVRFGRVYGPELRVAPRVTVNLHANAFNFDAGESEAEVRELSVKTLSGNNFKVRARIYIAGRSVFPTGGTNNPILTIVTLALRLANHVTKQLA
jgi:choline dehydrogenase-like flavoprotein